MIRLNDLKNFTESATHPTFSDAARKLGISQPALSESIRRFEKDLGGTLFFRAKSGVALTPLGRATFEKSKNLLSLMADLPAAASPNAVRPWVGLGCHNVVACYLLPKVLTSLHTVEPQARIKLQHGSSRQIQRAVQNGRIDVGVVINPVSNPDLIVRRLASDRINVWTHPDGLLKEQILCDLRMNQAQHILRKWKNRPPTLLPSTSLEVIVKLAEARLGHAILPERAIQLFSRDLVLKPGTPEFSDEIYLLYRPEFGKTRYEQHILKSVTQALK